MLKKLNFQSLALQHFRLIKNSFNIIIFLLGSCSRHYILYSHSIWLKSPGHPSCYPNNRDCTWLIETRVGLELGVYVFQFHLQYGGSHCPYDYLKIYDGESPSSPLIGRLCGQLAQFSFHSSGRFLLLQFYSDGSVVMPGFWLYIYGHSFGKSNT